MSNNSNKMWHLRGLDKDQNLVEEFQKVDSQYVGTLDDTIAVRIPDNMTVEEAFNLAEEILQITNKSVIVVPTGVDILQLVPLDETEHNNGR